MLDGKIKSVGRNSTDPAGSSCVVRPSSCHPLPVGAAGTTWCQTERLLEDSGLMEAPTLIRSSRRSRKETNPTDETGKTQQQL